jgi:hypothetical protein
MFLGLVLISGRPKAIMMSKTTENEVYAQSDQLSGRFFSTKAGVLSVE